MEDETFLYENIPEPESTHGASQLDGQRRCLVVDGMAVLHLVASTGKVKTLASLSSIFNSIIKEKMYAEVRLVFDPYCEKSSKMATREKRQNGVEATYYAVNKSTNLSNINMTQFPSHEKTKQEVSVFLAKEFIENHFRYCLCR